MKQYLLEGKTAIVTGASCGIGLAIAELYAQEGANVVLTARGRAKLDAAVEQVNRACSNGSRAIGVAGDASTTEAAKSAVETCIKEFGRLDILVNNAGIGEQWRIDCIPDEIVDKTIAVNFRGPVVWTREALQHMLPQGSGCGPRSMNYTWKDVSLYALGVGATRHDLPYFFEKYKHGMKALPTFALLPYINTVNMEPIRHVPYGPNELVSDYIVSHIGYTPNRLHMAMDLTIDGPIDAYLYPCAEQVFRNAVPGQLAGAEDLRTEGLQAERKARSVLIQQNAGDLKFTPGLLFLQIFQKAVRKGADAIGNKHHVRVLKAFLLHEPQGLFERRGIVGIAAQKGFGGFEHVLPVILAWYKEVCPELVHTGEMNHGKAPFSLHGSIQQRQGYRFAPGGRLFGGTGLIQHTDNIPAPFGNRLPALVLLQPLPL